MTSDPLARWILFAALLLAALGLFGLPGVGPPPHMDDDELLRHAFRANLSGFLLLIAAVLLAASAALRRAWGGLGGVPGPAFAGLVVLAQNSWPGAPRLLLGGALGWLAWRAARAWWAPA